MNKGWLELESDPGLFTLLLEENGVHGVQVEEIYDLQKQMEGEVYGFIFLFRWIEERRSRRKTNTEVESLVTDVDAVNNIFFAQQIIPNSCATHALLSVLLNCDNKVKLGKTLTLIKDFTDKMSPEDKGFAIANMPELARVHNSFARPDNSKPVPEKQTGLSSVTRMESESFHFVSYVPIRGRLFELDGLKPHPIDHGPWERGEAWTEKFRRVITDRLGMATGGEPYHDIRFNLMAVVPDKRQLMEHKLATLKTNRNIVLECLQQVVSPASSETSDLEVRGHSEGVKKSVTFTAGTTVISTPELSDSDTLTSATEESDQVLSLHSKTSSSSHPSILKTSTSSLPSSSPVPPTRTASATAAPEHKPLSPSANSIYANEETPMLSPMMMLEDCPESLVEVEIDCEDVKMENDSEDMVKDNSNIKEEKMDTSCDPPKLENGLSPLSHHSVKMELGEGGQHRSDVTKPLSIETKFTGSPCAASGESTDTASEVGSGFSSPGSLNTSSCQSSPDYAAGKSEHPEPHHRHRRKRRSSQAFTPKDLLDLLKNVENEIELCETNLREENEKRKKYKIDACRRTHNYDQFLVTFLSMLAEQNLLAPLVEESISGRRPSAGATAKLPAKVTPKKSILKVADKITQKKKKSKYKKKGKK